MLGGEGAKAIAKSLDISVHTVNGYTKTIYKHFGVKGRAQLQAIWHRRAGFRCDWTRG